MEEEEDRDKNAEIFSEALFTYLWFTENLISGSTAAETVGEQSDFIADAAKAVVVLSALTVPSFNDNMENYFKKHDMTRRSVFTFLTVSCFKNHEENKDDIFAVVLNTCTFVYRLVIFCQHRGHVEYIEFASMCWNEIYEIDIKDEFVAKGGWDQFKTYVMQNRYVPKDKDTDRRVFVNFLEEINYLFPKLDINSKQRYTHMFSPAAALAELEAAATVGLLASGLTQGSLKAFARSDDLVCEADSNTQIAGCDQNDDGICELLEDSDEELFQELVRVSLDSISKVHSEDPASDCIVCQTENGLRTTSRDDLVCPKHHPDSFYYLVTNPEEDNVCDEIG